MLVSHKYKFIFIKTSKTAGTSLEVQLAKQMGPDDIVTPIFPAAADHTPRNYEWDGPHGRVTLFNHIGATEVREAVGRAIYDEYTTFCVEREPVSKCISHFSMLRNSIHHNQKSRNLTWPAYVAAKKFPINHKAYTDTDGTLMVDRILRYENLETELSALADQLGIPFDGIHAREKSGFREPIVPTNRQRRAIYQAFHKSLRHCDYTLELSDRPSLVSRLFRR